jgi:hypothetical protein
VLWTGPVTVLLPDDREVRGEGRVRWHWRPFSDLRIEVDSAEHSAVSSPPFDLVGLRLDDGAISEVTTLSQSDRPPTTVRTLSAEWITIGDPSLGARQVRFLVPNFPRFCGDQVKKGRSVWLGRLEAHIGPWHVRLDAVVDQPSNEHMLTAGYTVTHTGLLTRRDGAPIDVADAERPLEALSWLLTLLRGGYTAPLAWRGERNGGVAWTRFFVNWPIDGWTGQKGLMPEGYSHHENPDVQESVGNALTRLLDHLANPDWRYVLLHSLQWYVAAHNGHHLGDIIVAQAGLELLAYAHFVLPGRLSKQGFKELPAADQLQLLLTSLAVPLAVPAPLTRLVAYAKETGIDGPEAVTRFRNSVVHPPTRSRHALAYTAKQNDARDLSIHYLERALLGTIGYDSLIQDRIYDYYMCRVSQDRSECPSNGEGRLRDACP